MANLSLKNVTKIYRRVFKAVDDLSLEIDDKEFVVISGPSGSGKTALLRMLAGQEKVTSGEICVDGHRVDHLPMKQRGIALCSHDRRLNLKIDIAGRLSHNLQYYNRKNPDFCEMS